eukprot:1187862-Prorocentrum_minimum.AAC.2
MRLRRAGHLASSRRMTRILWSTPAPTTSAAAPAALPVLFRTAAPTWTRTVLSRSSVPANVATSCATSRPSAT